MEDQDHSANEGTGPEFWAGLGELLQEAESRLPFRPLKRRLGVRTFSEFIQHIEGLKSHAYCQLLAHKKGEPFYQNNAYSRLEGARSAFCSDVKAFRKIYEHIKKSRHKVFGPELIEGLDSPIYGTFMAKGMSFKTHDLVIIVSNNAFLPPTAEDIEGLDKALSISRPWLRKILDSEERKKRAQKILWAMQQLPFPLRISRQGRVIFQNQEGNFAQEKSFPMGEYQLGLGERAVDAGLLDFHQQKRLSLLGELFNTLRHELSNPMYGLQLGSELMDSPSLTPENRELVQAIGQNALRCLELIQDFQELYSGTACTQWTGLQTLAKNALRIAKFELRGIQVIVELGEEDTKAPTWVGQVLFNFIINAAQSLRKEEITKPSLEICVKDSCLLVRDNGPGVRLEHQAQLFTPFFTTRPEGTGLGLSISKRLAEKHGASIGFRNNDPLPGATFWLNLAYAHSDH